MTRVDSPSGSQTNYRYDPLYGSLRYRQMGNGTIAYYEFDGAERMAKIRHAKSDGTPLSYFEFDRGVTGRIDAVDREGDLRIAYSYDALDRLTAEVWQRRSDSVQIYAFFYDYDAVNNRTKMRREAGSGIATESAYYWYDDVDALHTRQVYPGPVNAYYEYDLNGALTKQIENGSTTYYEYGPHGLVTRVVPPTGSPWRLWYDTQLNRYAIDKGGTVTYYLWEGLRLLEERSEDGSMVARYTHGYARNPDIGSAVEVERVANGTTYYQYHHFDHRGTAYKVTDAAQNTQLSYTLDAFGREIVPTGGGDPNVPNEMVYQSNWLTYSIGGQRIGLSRYRIYDVETGIFASRDFLRYLNKYRAWSNNPVGQVDRDGLGNHDADTRAYESDKEIMELEQKYPMLKDTGAFESQKRVNEAIHERTRRAADPRNRLPDDYCDCYAWEMMKELAALGFEKKAGFEMDRQLRAVPWLHRLGYRAFSRDSMIAVVFTVPYLIAAAMKRAHEYCSLPREKREELERAARAAEHTERVREQDEQRRLRAERLREQLSTESGRRTWEENVRKADQNESLIKALDEGGVEVPSDLINQRLRDERTLWLGR